MNKKLLMVVVSVFLALSIGALFGACAPTTAPKPAPVTTPAPVPTPAPKPAKPYPVMIPNVPMPEFMTFLGGSDPATGYSLLSRVYQDAIRKYWPKVATRMELGTAAKAIVQVDDGSIFMGHTMTASISDALAGKPPTFPKPLKNLSIMAIAPSGNALLPLVLGDSKIQDLSEIKGKRLFVGPQGSGQETCVELLLKEGYGFDYKDIAAAGGLVFRASHADGASALLEGNVDIGFFTLTHPDANVLRVATSPKGMRILPFSEKALKGVFALPYMYSRGFVPPTAYPGMKEPFTQTMTDAFITIVPPNIPPDVVYDLLVAAYEDDGARFKAMHPALAGLDFIGKYVGRETPVPYHPGAKKFWSELWKLRGLS